jgi:hypothetical protein
MWTRSRGEEDPQVSALDTLVGRETRFFSPADGSQNFRFFLSPHLIHNCPVYGE